VASNRPACGPFVDETEHHDDEGRSGQTRPVTRWSRKADPDVKTSERLYVDERRTEREIAQLLGVSRSRMAKAMEEAGIERRSSNRACPVSAAGALIKGAFAALGATHARSLAGSIVPSRRSRGRSPPTGGARATDVARQKPRHACGLVGRNRPSWPNADDFGRWWRRSSKSAGHLRRSPTGSPRWSLRTRKCA
jgi:hypothetical protein